MPGPRAAMGRWPRPLWLLLLWGAGAATAAAPLPVVTTTADLKSLVEAVGGERVQVSAIVPPNLDPEDYQPKLSDLAGLKEARLVVRVGVDYDLWFDPLLRQANRRELERGGACYVDASYAVALLDVNAANLGPGGHAHGSGNPHYWLDPANAEIITGNILEALARIDPGNAKAYEQRRLAFLARLETKQREWAGRLAPLQGRPLLAYHNSWSYFARRFRLNFAGFVEPRPGVPPSPAHLAQLLRQMREDGITLIVREPRESARTADTLAARGGARVAVLAASVGALPEARDYLSLFDTNVDRLAAAWQGN
jgi:ABC-type Zn uptake system ZnuABC Zn-binding protein ZnuA